MHRRMLNLALALGLVTAPLVAGAEELQIKMATLAPEGSPWLNKWYEVVDEFTKRSPVPVKITTYGSGVMGDEPDYVRKIKIGQIQMLGVTTSGIALLMPEMLVLNLPFLFQNYDEVDHVVQKLQPKFEQLAAERGLYLVGMLDQGMIEAFSQHLVTSAQEFLQKKVWIWGADPVAVNLSKVLNINAVVLGVPEVLPGLQTGLIDTMFSSSTALVALQWHTQMQYYYRVKLRYDPAAIFLSDKVFKKMPADKVEPFKQVLKEVNDEFMRPFLQELRRTEEETSAMLISEAGLKEVAWTPEQIEPVKKKALEVYDIMAGQYYPKELLLQVQQLLADYRSQAK